MRPYLLPARWPRTGGATAAPRPERPGGPGIGADRAGLANKQIAYTLNIASTRKTSEEHPEQARGPDRTQAATAAIQRASSTYETGDRRNVSRFLENLALSAPLYIVCAFGSGAGHNTPYQSPSGGTPPGGFRDG